MSRLRLSNPVTGDVYIPYTTGPVTTAGRTDYCRTCQEPTTRHLDACPHRTHELSMADQLLALDQLR
jgi:hypothetical protein